MTPHPDPLVWLVPIRVDHHRLELNSVLRLHICGFTTYSTLVQAIVISIHTERYTEENLKDTAIKMVLEATMIV